MKQAPTPPEIYEQPQEQVQRCQCICDCEATATKEDEHGKRLCESCYNDYYGIA